MTDRDEFAGQRVVVMGLGRFGGGAGVTRFLAERGADVLLTDRLSAEDLSDSLAQVQDLVDAGSVALRLGEHNVSDFTTCELVVVNPAVKPGDRFVRAAEAAGIEVTTEMRLLVERLPNRLRTIGVTGSAGKSTVTAMIGHVLGKVLGVGVSELGKGNQSPNPQSPNRNSPNVWVGGNIGVSLLPKIDEIGEDDWVVLELSSFMLDRLREDNHFPGWSPHAAVVTNISPNHLDWHGSMADYVSAKQVIVRYQQPGDAALVGSGVTDWAVARDVVRRVIDSATSVGRRSLRLPGEHNRVNAAMAAAAVEAIGLHDAAGAVELLGDFGGLPYRLQLVAERAGVRYYNDSKSTTPEAAMLAVQAFLEDGDRPGIHLILGGKDKGSDLRPLANLAASACKAVYTIGDLGEAIAERIDQADPSADCAESDRADERGAAVVRCGTLEQAVQAIGRRVEPGDVVLLSPGCASWDQFANYEARGDRFVSLVKGDGGARG